MRTPYLKSFMLGKLLHTIFISQVQVRGEADLVDLL